MIKVIMVIAFVVFAITILYVIKLIFGDLLVTAFSKKKTLDAKITAKYETEIATQRAYVGNNYNFTGGAGEAVMEKALQYIMTFETNDGIYTLEVPKDVFDNYSEGYSGKLEIKAKKFLGFM